MRKLFWFIPVLLLFQCICSGSALADTWTYSYQGNSFNQFDGFYSCPPECGISGSFTLNAPLPNNVISDRFDPMSFYFTDGDLTWTATDGTTSDVTYETFDFNTDASGNIIGWYMGAAIGTAPLQIDFGSEGGVGFEGEPIDDLDDTDICDGPGPCLAGAEVFDDPGTWTVTETVTPPESVPEPSTLSLLLLGALTLGSLATLRKKVVPA